MIYLYQKNTLCDDLEVIMLDIDSTSLLNKSIYTMTMLS